MGYEEKKRSKKKFWSRFEAHDRNNGEEYIVFWWELFELVQIKDTKGILGRNFPKFELEHTFFTSSEDIEDVRGVKLIEDERICFE